MYTLDDILDEGWKFQIRMFISFPQFVFCSRDEVYFPKISYVSVADGGTLHSKWQLTAVAMYHFHSWRHKATYDIIVALYCHVVSGCLDVSNKDLAIIENNQLR